MVSCIQKEDIEPVSRRPGLCADLPWGGRCKDGDVLFVVYLTSLNIFEFYLTMILSVDPMVEHW